MMAYGKLDESVKGLWVRHIKNLLKHNRQEEKKKKWIETWPKGPWVSTRGFGAAIYSLLLRKVILKILKLNG